MFGMLSRRKYEVMESFYMPDSGPAISTVKMDLIKYNGLEVYVYLHPNRTIELKYNVASGRSIPGMLIRTIKLWATSPFVDSMNANEFVKRTFTR